MRDRRLEVRAPPGMPGSSDRSSESIDAGAIAALSPPSWSQLMEVMFLFGVVEPLMRGPM